MIRALLAYVQEHDPTVRTRAGHVRLLATSALIDGVPVALTPSSLAVLRVLVASAGRVVSREELLGALPGSSADPHAAEVAIARLRESVGLELIQTVVKRGYRLAL